MWLAGGCDDLGKPSDLVLELDYETLMMEQRTSLPTKSAYGVLYKYRGRLYYLDETMRLYSYNRHGTWFQ
jgi:hypothetical protein